MSTAGERFFTIGINVWDERGQHGRAVTEV